MITVYGKKGCAKCESFKDKMARLNQLFLYVDVSDLEKMWKDDPISACEAKSAVTFNNGHMPTIDIDGGLFDYAAAIKHIKNRK